MLIIRQGKDWSRTWPIYAPGTSTPLDISTWTFKAQIRASVVDTAALYEWNNTLPNVVLGNGTLTLKVPAATSAAWTFSRGVYDMELTDPSARIAPVEAGTVLVIPEVTRS